MRNDLLLQRVFGLAGTVALGAVSLALFVAAATNPPEVYFLGNWPAPFGIVLVLDRLAALMLTADGGAGASSCSFTPSAPAGMRGAGISTRCSSSS
jgi:formate hydrogenlyase subunit 3/multisubunit Na+/H+ antiporter MnhD subunit